MDQVKLYLTYALYIGLILSFVVLSWHLLLHKQWKMVLLCLFFIAVAQGEFFLCLMGFLIALIIGWQEAAKWDIKKLMRIYSVLFVLCFFVSANNFVFEMMHPPKPPDPKAKLLAKPPPKPSGSFQER